MWFRSNKKKLCSLWSTKWFLILLACTCGLLASFPWPPGPRSALGLRLQPPSQVRVESCSELDTQSLIVLELKIFILLQLFLVPNISAVNVYFFAIAIVLFAFEQKDCAHRCTMYLLTAFSLRPRDWSAMKMMKVCLRMMLWRPSAVKMSHYCENCEKTLRDQTSLPDEKLELLPMDMLPVELPPLKLSFSEESFLLASRSAAATSMLSIFSSLWF